jgi:hypothetical protein
MSIEYRATGLDSPAIHAALVTPDDDNDLPDGVTRGLGIASGGAVAVRMMGGATVILPDGALAAGIIHPIRVSRVLSTGTTATGIVAYY